VDQQTKAALKKDTFVATTTQSLEWASEHRKSVIVNGGIVLAVIVAVVLGAVIYNSRSDAASAAFGAAMQTYQTPLAQAGMPTPPGVKTYSTSLDRAKAANAMFLDVANKYGMTPSGKNALYFAGLTQIEAGQTQQAEDTLKKVAGSWDSNLASLANFALAALYHKTGRDPQAIELLQQMAKKPTTAIPAGLAQLQLAQVYTDEGKTAEARTVYATVKQSDPKGPAAAIANEKLNPGAAPQMPQQ
jgi:predicted negative regulator of RcsB-dependent stress response